MSANQYIVDAMTRKQILNQGYIEGRIKKIKPLFFELAKELEKEINRKNITSFSKARKRTLYDDLNKIISSTMISANELVLTEAIELGKNEAVFTSKVLSKVITIKTAAINLDVIVASVSKKKMKLLKGKQYSELTIDQAFSKFDKSASKAIGKAIRGGIALGKTTPQIAKEVSNLTKRRTLAQAEALVRTSINHASQIARTETSLANNDIISGEKFVATLDSGTTVTCAGLDGEVFKIGEGISPAVHWGCRSVRVPVVNGKYAKLNIVGERPSKGSAGKEKVSGKVTYGGFLKRQSNEFQSEVLGKKRAELFRSGKVSIGGFTNKRGRLYTIKELEKKFDITI